MAEILKLDQTVVDRIAAGEVIQRPANAIKELIENSLDANATSINITVKEGGLKMLQIQDNGIGIRRCDLEIVCERFTTSKLRQFEDLQTINTFGFRGEALASISHVAHVTIISKVENAVCAYRGDYVNGKLKAPPHPQASNQGTIITVEDIFYNMAIRRRTMRPANDEYRKIIEVVGNYAIHNSHRCAFSLKKAGEPVHVRTQVGATSTDSIRQLYGHEIAKELLTFDLENDVPRFRATGCVTNANYSTKSLIFVLFINGRLVECTDLKRALDQMYATYLPKQCHPFVYLSLELNPCSIDVNVHPTKHEVHLLDEDLIVPSVCTALESKLLEVTQSRVFYTQARLPSMLNSEATASTAVVNRNNNACEVPPTPKHTVRTDSSTQKLDQCLYSSQQQLKLSQQERRPVTQLTSVANLRKTFEDECHPAIRDVFAQHVFIGVINTQYALLQHSTKIYLCHTERILQEFLYQLVISNFGRLPSISFAQKLSIHDLALLALDECNWQPSEMDDGNRTEIATNVVQLWCAKAEMLHEYFGICTDADSGDLCGLPLLLDYVPDTVHLPAFVVRLATEVDWSEEEVCFKSCAREIANFYARITEDVRCVDNADNTDEHDWRWIVEYVIYTAVKKQFLPAKNCADNGGILEIANLPNLYKVFERC